MNDSNQSGRSESTIEMEIYQDDIQNCIALSVDSRIEKMVELTSDIEELLGLQSDKEFRMQRVNLFRQRAVAEGIPPVLDPEFSVKPGCRSLGLTWAFRRSKLLRFHSILSLRFRYFAKLCNYLIQHHTPLIVFSMEMAPCCLGLMVCGCLHHNVIAVYYTFDVYRSPLSSSC